MITAKTKLASSTLEFADDTVLFAPNMTTLIAALQIYADEASKLGLRINYAKTKVMMIGVSEPPQTITVNGNSVQVVPDFIYLGSKIHRSGDILQEVTRRKALAGDIFRRLWRPLWKHRNITNRTKFRIYNACVLSVLLYGSEIWALSPTLAKSLSGFDNRCERRILGIRWQDSVRNEEVRRLSMQPPLQRRMAQRRLRWLGHMLRMDVDHPTLKIFNFEPQLENWRRPRGRPRSRWSDVVRDDLSDLDTSFARARESAMDRNSWRRLVSFAASTPHRHET